METTGCIRFPSACCACAELAAGHNGQTEVIKQTFQRFADLHYARLQWRASREWARYVCKPLAQLRPRVRHQRFRSACRVSHEECNAQSKKRGQLGLGHTAAQRGLRGACFAQALEKRVTE